MGRLHYSSFDSRILSDVLMSYPKQRKVMVCNTMHAQALFRVIGQ